MQLTRRVCTTVAVVAIQRLGEVAWSKRNEQRLRARGGVEAGQRHYPLMVALHATWLAATLIEGSAGRTRIRWAPTVAFLAVQPLRYWVISTLGDRWTTKIIVVDEPPIATGPFRWVRHPNYLVVAVEMATLPLVFGARRTAFVASIANAGVMALRIPAEERALDSAHR